MLSCWLCVICPTGVRQWVASSFTQRPVPISDSLCGWRDLWPRPYPRQRSHPKPRPSPAHVHRSLLGWDSRVVYSIPARRRLLFPVWKLRAAVWSLPFIPPSLKCHLNPTSAKIAGCNFWQVTSPHETSEDRPLRHFTLRLFSPSFHSVIIQLMHLVFEG